MTDFELFVPLEALTSVWTRLLKTGGPEGIKPIGKSTRETARIEAGLPRLGPDINDRIVPPEANLEGIAFSLSKGVLPWTRSGCKDGYLWIRQTKAGRISG